MDELRACPFCGDGLHDIAEWSTRRRQFYVHPQNGCVVAGTIVPSTSPDRIAAWNRRAAAPAPVVSEAMVEAAAVVLWADYEAVDDKSATYAWATGVGLGHDAEGERTDWRKSARRALTAALEVKG